MPSRLPRPSALLGLGAIALVLLLASCGDTLDELLDVETPGRIREETLADPTNARLLVSSAVGSFECALASYALSTGLLGDELSDTENFTQWFFDQRDLDENTDGGDCASFTAVYVPLSTARWQADYAVGLLDEWTDTQVPDRRSLLATALTYAGYSLVLFGEGMCEAAIDGGPRLDPSQLTQLAEERFSRAIEIAQAVAEQDVLDLARVGRARARLNLDRTAEAAEDAALVTPGFVWNASYSAAAARAENKIFTAVQRDRFASVEDDYRDLQHAGILDPRVRLIDSGQPGHDGTHNVWLQTKYPAIDAPIVMASYVEAQLIVAEAAVAGGDPDAAVAIINELHARAGLPAFSSSSTDETMDQVMYERRAEFFLDGHHLGDVRRYGLPLTPAAGSPYLLQKGGVYGDSRCVPLSAREALNNPNAR